MRNNPISPQNVHDEVIAELARYSEMIKRERHLGPNAPVLEGIGLAIVIIERMKLEAALKEELADLKKSS